jgi:hypothetical protein
MKAHAKRDYKVAVVVITGAGLPAAALICHPR